MLNCLKLPVVPGMMCIMLKTGVDDSIVRRNETVLVAAVKVDAVSVEEEPIS